MLRCESALALLLFVVTRNIFLRPVLDNRPGEAKSHNNHVSHAPGNESRAVTFYRRRSEACLFPSLSRWVSCWCVSALPFPKHLPWIASKAKLEHRWLVILNQRIWPPSHRGGHSLSSLSLTWQLLSFYFSFFYLLLSTSEKVSFTSLSKIQAFSSESLRRSPNSRAEFQTELDVLQWPPPCSSGEADLYFHKEEHYNVCVCGGVWGWGRGGGGACWCCTRAKMSSGFENIGVWSIHCQ